MKEQNYDKLSPGTAKVISSIVMPLKDNTVKISVKSVLGYGMATRPIAPGTEIIVSVSENLKSLLSGKNAGEEINLIILQQNRMNSDSLSWSAVDVIR